MRRGWHSVVVVMGASALVGCSSELRTDAGADGSTAPAIPAEASETTPTEPAEPATTSSTTPTTSTTPVATTMPVGTDLSTTPPPSTTITESTVQPSTTAPAPTTSAPSSSTYVVPVADPSVASWGEGHAGYPATDLFASCGTQIVSPVNGTLTEVRRVDSWDPNVDNPATRGGRSVTIVGDDGVRYYLSHLDEIDPALTPGVRIAAGQQLGTVGLTGRTSGCHVHFGISPPCPGKEWSIRRGAVEPARYLDAWRAGEQTSPAEEVNSWAADNPDACAAAMQDPNAPDS